MITDLAFATNAQPRRHAVDEGWDGDLNGFPDDGAPDGWSFEEGGLDSYGRAERALLRAQQAIVDQRDRLEKVTMHFLQLSSHVILTGHSLGLS